MTGAYSVHQAYPRLYIPDDTLEDISHLHDLDSLIDIRLGVHIDED